MGYYQTFIDKQKRLEVERIENEKKKKQNQIILN